MKLSGKSNLIDIFTSYEVKKNLFDLNVKNFNYWIFIRQYIYDLISTKTNKSGQAHTEVKISHKLSRLVLFFKNSLLFVQKNPFWRLKKVDMLVFNHSRRVLNSKYYECLYTDAFLMKSSYSYFVYEKPYLGLHFSPVYTNNLRYLDYFYLVIALKIKFIRLFKFFKFNSYEKNQIYKLVNDINITFEVKISPIRIENYIETLYFFNKYLKIYFKKIFNATKPKIIVQVVSYSFERLILNDIAKEFKIPTVEFQHGEITSNHINYNIKKIGLLNIPDYLFLFGRFWKDKAFFPIENNKLKVTGWPYLENKVTLFKNFSTVIKSYKNILFISQGIIGHKLSKIAIELKKLISNDYKIIYKLHPGEYDRWRRDYPWLLSSNVEVIDNNNNDIHFYLSTAKIQVGVYSTVLYEGLNYPLKTIIMKIPGYENIKDLIDNKNIFLANNSIAIMEIIYNFEKNLNVSLNNDQIFFIWESNSLNNIESEIKNIINSNL